MTTSEHPITRTELREELQHYATKADLAEISGELKALRWTMSLVGVGLSILILALKLIE